MKKNSFYLWAMMFVTALCLGFTSCSDDDDDDDNVVTGEGIVGTWQMTIVENHYKGGEVETADFTPYEQYYAQYLQFKSDGAAVSYEYDEGEWDVDHMKYTYENNYITTYDEDGYLGKAEVISLNKTTLVVKSNEDLDDEDVEYMIQTFKRVSDDKVKNAK